MALSFTANQIALLGRYFYDDDAKFDPEYRKVCQAVYDFVGLGDPYDEALVMNFVKSIMSGITSPILKEEKNLTYLVGKSIYWAEQGAAS